ncbi:bifunctional glutamate N-acetyltransferase/amino-acid acetyltransferase ArgJ [Thermospira aquatica]|uniref:Arginine biosynthesis bifunctional protein ArgJ n=1 Tax=Thermospira aquatica TaxID=2828656 RepID=A0AAX3BH16_9SPIR|nr:bifunctional glutamate N-acetyltransferase/amino-acid acetyltransferase ArgJ [Thermospira aquatica]URA11304.1 bifunctional glutamate N-acetyltransferase/amino-acid acetyltransferase ArgJ [Thermospira aquatica]
MENFRILENGGINSPKGFRATGVSCGLKEGGYKDIALLYSSIPCETVCAFTQNRVKAAPILINMERLDNKIQAIITNSGNANCVTGEEGIQNAREMAEMTEKFLDIPAGSVMVASTGVIGRKLDMEKIRYGIQRICNTIKTDNDIRSYATAIMTTDTKQKTLACEFDIEGVPVRIGITAKGAGMIKPNLKIPHATMLVYITTDAAISHEMLELALDEALSLSFNRISVDNDTSTNDSVFLLANGLAENPSITQEGEAFSRFKEALIFVCQEIAKMIVKDGEGATKLVKIDIKNALTSTDAEKIARSIADSYLVKTAIFGQNPNWGRILAAMGYSGAKFELDRVVVKLNGVEIFSRGEPQKTGIGQADVLMRENELTIEIDLAIGHKDYFLWTCDLSHDYVKINSHYIS